MRHLLLVPRWLVGCPLSEAYAGDAQSCLAGALARGPRQLLRRADLQGLVMRHLLLGSHWPVGRALDKVHVDDAPQFFHQLSWPEGLAICFVGPSCVG